MRLNVQRTALHMGAAVAALVLAAGLHTALAEVVEGGGVAALSDPTDLTSIFQSDGSGNPSIGDSIDGATVLDTSQFGGKTAAEFIAGLDELVTNGGFDSDTAWIKNNSATISGGVGNLTASNDAFKQDLAGLSDGDSVLVVVDLNQTSSGAFRIYVGGVLTYNEFYNTAGASQITIVLPWGATSDQFEVRSAGWVGTVDNASVKHLPGNHTVAAGTGPTLLDAFDQSNPALTDNGGRGEELVSDPSFADSGAWSAASGGSVSLSGNQLTATTVDGDSAGGASGDDAFTLEIGAEYEGSWTAVSFSSDGYQVGIGLGAGFDQYNSGVITGLGAQSAVFRATSDGAMQVKLYARSGGTGDQTAVFSSISVRKVLTAFDERGPELVTNGTFDSDISGWASGRSAILTHESGVLRVTNSPSISSGVADWALTTEIGATYEFEATMTAAGSGASSGRVNVRTAAGLSGTALFSDDGVSAGETISGTFVATGTTTYMMVGVFAGGVSGYCEFDNISVKKVPYPNLVTNGTFDADSDWTKGTGWTIGSGTLNFSGTATADAQQNITSPDNKWVLIRFYVSAISNGGIYVIDPILSTGGDTLGNVTTTGWHEAYVRCDPARQNRLTFRFIVSSGTGTCSIDNVSVQEVPASIARLNVLNTDGSTDKLEWDLTGYSGLSDMTVVMAIKTSDNQAVLLAENASDYALALHDGSADTTLSSNAGAPSYRIDGADWAPATRDDLHTGIADDSFHIVSLTGLDLTAWASFGIAYFGSSSVWNAAADWAFLSIFPTNSETLALAEAAAAEKIKVVNPAYTLAA